MSAIFAATIGSRTNIFETPSVRLPDPPTPNSVPANYSLATPEPSSPHYVGSDWKVTISLEDQGRHGTGAAGRWRSGESLHGAVKLEPMVEGARKVTSCIVRAFWQSTSHYMDQRIVIMPPPKGLRGKLQPALSTMKAISETRVEWHRGYLVGGEGQEVWHGGELEAISREVEGDFPLLEDGQLPPLANAEHPDPHHNDSWTLPFVFSLPTASRVAAANPIPQSPEIRRVLQRFERTPPPSYFHNEPSTSSSPLPSSVEYVVEALLRLADPIEIAPSPSTQPSSETELPSELASSVALSEAVTEDAPPEIAPPTHNGASDPPSFESATSLQPSTSYSSYGLLTPTSTLLTTRITFPFEPSDVHIQDLYSSWRPTTTGHWALLLAKHTGLKLEEMEDDRPVTEGVVPLFGKDPRDEALGGAHLGGSRELKSAAMLAREGGRGAWLVWYKRLDQRNAFGKLQGYLTSEVSSPNPFIIARHAPSFPILFHFQYSLLAELANTSSKAKPVLLEKIVMTLCRRTLVRGGRIGLPAFSMIELRRQEIRLADEGLGLEVTRGSTMSMGRKEDKAKGPGALRVEAGGEAKEMKLEFDLQSEGIASTGKAMVPLREVEVSFRTPNIEMEYILSITVHPVGKACFFALRVPVQVVSGDFDEVPEFDHGAPPHHFAHAHAAPVPANGARHEHEAEAPLPDYSEN